LQILGFAIPGTPIINKTLNFVNFAHSDFVAFAAYIALFANTSGMHLASAFLVAILATIVPRGFHREGGPAPDEVEKRISDDAYHHLDLDGIGNPYSMIAGGIIIGMSQERCSLTSRLQGSLL